MHFPLKRLYLAYKKAKKEAFGDTNCAHGQKFAEYERNLHQNLVQLQQIIEPRSPVQWDEDVTFIGDTTCIPKSLSPPHSKPINVTIHCQSSDPLEQWRRQCREGQQAAASFRPVINATVNMMIVSALWILEVGHLYDAKLDTRYAVGNRLRRFRPAPDSPAGSVGQLNELAPNLFQPYFSAYGTWRSAGLKAMRRDIEGGHRIIAVTMDLKQFYHEIDANFLLHDDYLRSIHLKLSPNDIEFTGKLIKSFATWARNAHNTMGVPDRGLPVGLTASGVIANVLLQEFDRQVVSLLNPTYYARYVDDVFLVLRHSEPFADGAAFVNWLGQRLGPMASTIDQDSTVNQDSGDMPSDGPALEIKFSYSGGSKLLFVGKKQKIFQLEGPHGIDLIGPIEEQIRQQTSEFRDLPHLPDAESAMAHRALLVTPDATLNADALRKADAVTLRRSGFAMLLGDVEAHARDLVPNSWETLRHQFYELSRRHLITPHGFFDYTRYLPRIVGVMVSCNDWDHADRFVAAFKQLLQILRTTCDVPRGAPGTSSGSIGPVINRACDNVGDRMIEAALQSGTCLTQWGARATNLTRLDKLIAAITEVFGLSHNPPWSLETIHNACNEFLFLDWSRVAYSTHWLEGFAEAPSSIASLGDGAVSATTTEAVDLFRRGTNLKPPHWPAIAFPTRPMPLRQITARAPSLLRNAKDLSTVVRGLRGTWMRDQSGLRLGPSDDKDSNIRECVFVPDTVNLKPKVAITSIEVTDSEWAAAANGTPSLTLERYQRLNAILDQVVASRERPNYVVLPECSLPRRWAMQMVGRVLRRGVSVIAGLEYRQDSEDKDALHNEVIVALRSNFPGYQTGVFLFQPKGDPAWHERQSLSEMFGKRLAPLSASCLQHPVYRHQGFCFGVLICSELTDIALRMHFQGKVDALFIPEWNQDVESFSILVEAASLDVHAYVVQANNRRYGDSRIRAPMKARFLRDTVRVGGGLNDYFVVGEIDYVSLRQFQSNVVPPSAEGTAYKPFPIGFSSRLAKYRRTTPK